jgi:pyruvate kinase
MLGHYTTGLRPSPALLLIAARPEPEGYERGVLPLPVRRTKILATVGPATDRPDRLAALIDAGVDAVRLNFSHGSDEEHRTLLRRIHLAARRAGREIAVVADVQGPKIRIGELAPSSLELVAGRRWTLDSNPAPGNERRVGVQVPSIHRSARPGDPVLLGDGNVELEVVRTKVGSIETKVVSGGVVSSHAGLFLPRARLRTTVFAARDRRDASVGLAEGIDYLALSFVGRSEDIRSARRWLDARAHGREVGVIAKIERAEALESIDSILKEADGIMVARGDLGIEVPLERLALEQKHLVRRANLAGKFVIVATQMLLSMVSAPRPTRAEATDVANAVLDGADAVMLSEESAVGRYPIDAVRWLDRIARATEGAFDPRPLREVEASDAAEGERAVASAAVRLAEGVNARAVVTPTHSGRTARLVARLRPACPVVALSNSASTRRRLALVGGVISMPAPVHRDLIELRTRAAELVAGAGIGPPGPIVLTAGYPVEGRPTNLVTLVDSGPELPAARRVAAPRGSRPARGGR